MKKILILILLVLFCAGSAFGGEFEDKLKQAEQGDSFSQFHIGTMYRWGKENVPPNSDKAIYWFKKAANQGHVDAQYALGGIYFTFGMVDEIFGLETTENDKQSFYWNKKAANQGHASAQYSLGNNYNQGKGVMRDYKQAVYWFKKSAEQGAGQAQNGLGVLYANGHGVKQNYKKAYMWYTLAVAQAHYFDIGNRDKIAEKLTPQQLSEAQEMAAKMQEKIDSSK